MTIVRSLRILFCAVAVGLFAAASSAPMADAQVSSSRQVSMAGAWVGSHSWSNGAVVQDVWDLYPDGSFTAGRPASASGAWLQSGDSVALAYDSGAEPLFVGTLRGGVISGATSTTGGLTGTWTMRRE